MASKHSGVLTLTPLYNYVFGTIEQVVVIRCGMYL